MKKFACVVLASVLACAVASAQRNEDGNLFRHQLELSGMAVSRAWLVDIAYHYRLNPFVGVGGSVGVWGNLISQDGAYGDGWRMSYNSNQPENVFLRPSVSLYSPMLLCTGGVEWKLYAEPGVVLQVPYGRAYVITYDAQDRYVDECEVTSSHGKWAMPDCRLGVTAQAQKCSFSIGYYVSTLDIYSEYRSMSFNGERFDWTLPKHKMQQGFFVSASYNF
ncbi:MAG: hypothetical protein ACI308_03345 [Muribaculaceae bacterium]